MNTFNIKERKVLSYEQFLKNKVGVEKTESTIVKKAYSGDKTGGKGIETLAEGQVNEHWKDKVQNVYADLEELKGYDETYGIAKRLGYEDAEKLWNDNPMIQGSTDPKDLKLAENYVMDVDGGDMAMEHAKAVIDRAMENHKKEGLKDEQASAGIINMVDAFEEICQENDIKDKDDDRRDMIVQALDNLLDDMTQQVEGFDNYPRAVKRNK